MWPRHLRETNMAKVLYIGEDIPLAQSHAAVLRDAGYDIQIEHNQFGARARFDGLPCEVVIVDVPAPDGGFGLLIQQARATWPSVRVIALTGEAAPEDSVVGQMGLWDPDSTLPRDISAKRLSDNVAHILATQSATGMEPH